MDHQEFIVKRKTHWYTYAGDFMNTLKAFIGTNYQGLPFAFAKSGVAFGIAGVFVVAALTDHCCQLLIRSKIYIINKMIKQQLDQEKITEDKVESLRERLQLSLGYGDVALRVYGAWCFHLTQASVFTTQFLLCINYFVFIGNTLGEIFPVKYTCQPNGTSPLRELMVRVKTERGGYGIPILHIPNLNRNLSERYRRAAATCNDSNETALNLTRKFRPQTDLNVDLMSLGREMRRQVQGPESSGRRAELNDVWSLQSLDGNGTDHCNITKIEKTAPNLSLIILFPLPIFLFTSIVRRVRYIAPMSSLATFALVTGAFSVLAYLIDEFRAGQFDWYKFETLPLFLCQMIAAFEGIGCILPIQASMVGCRHLFPAYIHASIFIILVTLCTFGTLGYMLYGDNVNQIIVLEIPQHTVLSTLVDVMLVISVIFTYPLQNFPVIEIVEGAILLPSQCCQKAIVQDTTEVNSVVNSEVNSENSTEVPPPPPPVQPKGVDFSMTDRSPTLIPLTVPAWKRNIIRVGLTLVIAGVAVLMQDYFAYLNAIAGAVGASFLAFILPCLIDLRLRWEEMSRPIWVKNIIIIVCAIILSLVGLGIIIDEMARGDK